MTVLHLVTPSVSPQPGGMQASVLRIATFLASTGDFQAFIYTSRQSAEHCGADPAHAGIEVVHLSEQRGLLLEPLGGQSIPFSENTPDAFLLEVFRADYLLLRNAVEARQRSLQQASHVMISFYMASAGFIAQQVADSLHIPHVASVRGSDFSREVRSPYHFDSLRFVVENATAVVTTNQEQAETLAAMFPSPCAFHTIHIALPEPETGPVWEAPAAGTVRLIADCGFSSKKATHLLLAAVGQLLERGAPLSLTVYGGIAPEEQAFWLERQQYYLGRFPQAFTFPGWVPPSSLGSLLRGSHIYCSTTLGEGCSQSRIRALTVGIPIVTTRCGALPQLAAGCRHVRLCPPGDLPGFVRELEAMVSEIRSGKIAIDHDRVHACRTYFSREREGADWSRVITESRLAPSRRPR